MSRIPTGRFPRAWVHRHALAVTLLLALTGCEQSTGELIQEIDAAREGCTEERLKAGAEECVQMFERYAEMGTDALESYIGALRALDEAVQRRGGITLDTAGLGRALTPSTGEAGMAGTWSDDPALRSGAVRAPIGEPDGWEAYEDQGRWSRDPGYRSLPPDRRPPEGGWDRRPPEQPAYDDSPRRGVLAPPDQRLRRPWIEDDARDRVYTDDGFERGRDGAGGWQQPYDPRYYDAPRGIRPGAYDGWGSSDPRYAPYGDPRMRGYGWQGTDPRYPPTGGPAYPGGTWGPDGGWREDWRSSDPYAYPPSYPR